LRKAHDELEIRVQERTAALRENEERLRLKLDSILSPDADISDLELTNILDIPEIQSMMEDFSRLTGMATAVLDLKGKVIEASGWQDICTKFHRVHAEAAGFCKESDLFLARNLKPGEYIAYKCRNNLWDVVTPLYIGNRHVSNIYTGQFLYIDETIPETIFIAQAEKYGFNRDEYLSALHRVPRFSRKQIDDLMSFMVKLTGFVSRLSYSNLKLARLMAEEKRVREELENLSGELEKRVTERTAELSLAQEAFRQAKKLQQRLKATWQL
jgi:ligand-binding sensor protein